MKKMKKILNRISALVLTVTLTASSLSGCGPMGDLAAAESASTPASTAEATKAIAQEIIHTANGTERAEELLHSETEKEHIDPLEARISVDWHDYIGDLDTFVYGALINEYQLAYKTFNAVLMLPDESQIFGIGYTDYSYYFEREDGNGGYFPAGFLALIGEPEIPDGITDEGLEIINLDNPDSEYQFVYAYNTKPYLEHCVIWNQYLRYGIDDNQHIVYMTQDYERGVCDENLGSLYSYDEKRVVYESDLGNYLDINGESLYGSIDYAEIQAEVNRILEEQDFNFAEVDVESTIYQAKEAMRSYLLSLQTETFMGCSVSELLEISENLEPKECIQMTPDGMILVDMTSAPPREPEALTKWLTGMCCGTAIVTCLAVCLFVPALAVTTAPVSGAAVEVFMEVVFQNRDVNNVDWRKVAIAAATGAALAWACPMLAGKAASAITTNLGNATLWGKVITAETATQLGKIAGYGILTFSNAVVAGSSSAAYAVLDEGTKEDVIDAFRLGVILSVFFTVAASLIAKGASGGINALKNTESNKWLMDLTEKASKFRELISEHQVKILDGKLDDILIPKSINEAAEAAGYQLKLQQTDNTELIKRIDQLPSDSNKNFVFKDDDGNVLTKSDLRKNGGNGRLELRESCDPEIRQAFEKHKVSHLQIKDGVPDFDPVSSYKVDLRLIRNRTVNFSNAYDKYLKEWTEDPSRIPRAIEDELKRRNLSIYDAKPNDVASILGDLKITIHEEAAANAGLNASTQIAGNTQEAIDGVVYLVDRTIHSKIGHAGGVSYASALGKIEVGTIYFKRLYDSVATGVTGTLIIREAQVQP